jgi:hypothetical protein
LLFGWTGTVLLCLAAIVLSFFAAGCFNPYWRRADMDYMMVYQVFLLNDGRPQSYFDHPGYLKIVLLDLWSRLFHWLGVLDAIALLLLLVAFGLDLVATFRGAKIEYGIFADCTIVIAAAWLFGNLPGLLAHRYAFHLGALFIALTVVFGQLEAVKIA